MPISSLLLLFSSRLLCLLCTPKKLYYLISSICVDPLRVKIFRKQFFILKLCTERSTTVIIQNSSLIGCYSTTVFVKYDELIQSTFYHSKSFNLWERDNWLICLSRAEQFFNLFQLFLTIFSVRSTGRSLAYTKSG